MLHTNVILKILPRLFGHKKLLILFILIISGSAVAQQDSPLQILLTFSEPMSRESIFVPGNYQVKANQNIPVEVIKVGVVEGDTAVVLFIYKKEDWLSFQITVNNLKDKAGNLINEEKNYAEITSDLTNYTAVKFIKP